MNLSMPYYLKHIIMVQINCQPPDKKKAPNHFINGQRLLLLQLQKLALLLNHYSGTWNSVALVVTLTLSFRSPE